MQNRFLIIVGAMQSGKSYLANKLIKAANQQGSSALIYNLGRSTDFAHAQEIELQTIKDREREIQGKEEKKLYLKYPTLDKCYNLKKQSFFNFKDFASTKNFYAKSAKCARVNRADERMFLNDFFLYQSNCVLVFDDAKTLFRYGLSDEHIQLFSRINHTGRKHKYLSYRNAGSDVVCIFHSLDHVSNELFDYATDIINFRYMFPPKFRTIEADHIRIAMQNSFKVLQTAPKYSYTRFDVHKGNQSFYNNQYNTLENV